VGAFGVRALSFEPFYVTVIYIELNVSAPVAIRRHRESGFRLRASLTPLLAVVLAACSPKPEPRTVFDFMDDGLARDGVLARCNQNREETLDDEECSNARRAAATIALEAERARAPELEQQSEAKLLALRDRQSVEPTADASSGAAFGSPVGSMLPSMSRSLEIEVEPPSNELVIAAPPLDVPELAVVPRPFLDEPAQR
jgi:hypothetical protein